MQRRAAFTLVELLVVVAIVGVLAGMLLPALAGAKSKARTISCLGNLRQWGLATLLYATDYDDYLPPEGQPNPSDRATNVGWYIQLPRQLDLPRYHDMAWRTNANVDPGRSVWICSANRRRSNGRNLFHYCLNQNVNGTGDQNRAVRLSALNHHSRVIWLFDSKNLPAVGGWTFVHTNLHGAGAQFLFLDGHVARFGRTAYRDPASGYPRLDHPDLRWLP